jgi:hypothetical protein
MNMKLWVTAEGLRVLAGRCEALVGEGENNQIILLPRYPDLAAARELPEDASAAPRRLARRRPVQSTHAVRGAAGSAAGAAGDQAGPRHALVKSW